MSDTKTSRKPSQRIITASGASVYLDALDEADIRMYDIAYGLNHVVRWAGQLGKRTVAAHSAMVTYMAQQVAPSYQVLHRHALLHDATEAYLGELPAVVKSYLPKYVELEETLHARILATWGIPALGKQGEAILKALDTIASAADMIIARAVKPPKSGSFSVPTKSGGNVIAQRVHRNDVLHLAMGHDGVYCTVPIGRTWAARIPPFEYYATELLGEYDYV